MSQRALLLVNLGTPASTDVADVRRYLREFLGDPDVISLPAPLRFLLLEGIILRTRPKKSAEAYRKVWTERGSPLMWHSMDLVDKVRGRVAPGTRVELAMRYGSPSIHDVLSRLQKDGVDDICVFPLYPQYSRASTKTVVTKINLEARRLGYAPTLSWVPAFYDAPEYIDAFAAVGRRVLDGGTFDKVLMSFHGYPVRYLREDDPSGSHCQRRSDCCDVDVDANRDCYKHQCEVTGRALSARLGLNHDDVGVCYQSRLRDNWAKPFTDTVVIDAARAGAKKMVVFCPAFVADCLETLEEIAIRADEDFREHGGESLTLVPSLNSEPEWVDAVVSLARAVSPAL
jgi:ferrochelatase